MLGAPVVNLARRVQAVGIASCMANSAHTIGLQRREAYALESKNPKEGRLQLPETHHQKPGHRKHGTLDRSHLKP